MFVCIARDDRSKKTQGLFRRSRRSYVPSPSRTGQTPNCCSKFALSCGASILLAILSRDVTKWYPFDYSLAHFVSLDTETDYSNSPQSPFAKRLPGNETKTRRKNTKVTDSRPFGNVDDHNDTKTYSQY